MGPGRGEPIMATDAGRADSGQVMATHRERIGSVVLSSLAMSGNVT
jgi:hypothetical protein